MFSGGDHPPESLDASGLPVLDGGVSTSVPTNSHPFKVSLMASNERSMVALAVLAVLATMLPYLNFLES
jgi:hypothetical protein